jgi:hypothetical protein
MFAEDDSVIKSQLAKYGVEHLHYLTPDTNILSILLLGIYPRNKMLKMKFFDPSNKSVQNLRRNIKFDTGKELHDYVPLYFATHTPMQYVLTHGQRAIFTQDNLIFIEIDSYSIFGEPGFLVSDGNAAAKITKFYRGIDGLSAIDWNAVNNRGYPSDENKRKKAAETLVPDFISTKYFTRIVTFNKQASFKLKSELEIMKNRFQKKYNDIDYRYLTRYTIEEDETHFYLE